MELSGMEIPKSEKRMQWWHEARFGMMIHWGLYSALAGEYECQRMDYIGEWIMSRFRIPISEYSRLADQFNPVAFDADRWMSLASKAGMKYLVITTKHHDGFAMYHSRCDPYNIVDATPFKRDPMKELAEACAKHGVKLCFYYSQALDWHEPDAGGAEGGHSNLGMSWTNDWDFPDNESKQFEQYFEKKVMPQVTEILTGYGPIGAIWFDCPFTITRSQCEELYGLVQSLQPDCIVNSRIGQGLGDYQSFGDNEAPGRPLDGYWETVATLNDTWGYKHFDDNWKPAPEIISLLTSLAGKNVNYVLNIGPDANGNLPEPAIRVLEDVGKWMDINAESVHGTEATPFATDTPWGPVTRRPGRLYFLLHREPDGPFRVNGLRNKVLSARILGAEDVLLDVRQSVADCSLEVALPTAQSVLPRVLAIDIDGEPDVEPGILQQGGGSVLLNADMAVIHKTGNSTISLTPTGIVDGWTDTADWLEWEFKVVNGGIFKVEVITASGGHSRPWQGGHDVEIAVGKTVLNARLDLDHMVEDVSARYYMQGVSSCGDVQIPDSGTYKLSLNALTIPQREHAGLNLRSIELRPCEI
jgi:alpha-L-fucosidase